MYTVTWTNIPFKQINALFEQQRTDTWICVSRIDLATCVCGDQSVEMDMCDAHTLSNALWTPSDVPAVVTPRQTTKSESHLKFLMLSEAKSRETRHVLLLRRYGQPTPES